MSENGLHKIPAMRSALVAIQELHKPVIEDGLLVGCLRCDWEVDGVWPCSTRRLADQGLGGGQDG